ncbi:MAG: hypothetical protein RLZZ305_822 [Actinomycetota bacterium]|jgi:predicted amidophosphoribosyltransferase
MGTHRTETLALHGGHTELLEIRALGPFEGELRDAVIGLKYRNERQRARALAGLMSVCIPPHADVITWAPTSALRTGERGYDQAELLARHLSAHTGVPWSRLLRRLDGAGQTGRTRAQRLVAPRFVAAPVASRRNVCVVDDVVTTGATLRAAASALLLAGAERVSGACVATVDA